MESKNHERDPAVQALWRSLWRPPHATLDAIASVLSEHWSRARDHTLRLFGPTADSWLKALEERGSDPHHLTRGGRLIR
jgi:hypothetical protein